MSVELWQKLREALAEIASLKAQVSALRTSAADYAQRIDRLEAKFGKTLTVPKK